MKSTLLLVTVLLLTLIPMTQAQEDVPSTRAVVCHHRDMNVREAPDIDSNSLGLISPGTTMTVLERDRDDYRGYPWTYATIDGTGLTGWVFSDYLVYLPMYVTTVAQTLHVRAEPWTHAEKIGDFAYGDKLEVLGRERIYGNDGLWLYVRGFETGTQGWVKTLNASGRSNERHFVRFNEICLSELPILAEVSFATPLQGAVWSNRPLELQADDSNDADTIGTLPNGTRVSVVELYEIDNNNRYWTHLQGGGLDGWFTSNTIYHDPIVLFPFGVNVNSNVNVRSAPNGEKIGQITSSQCIQVTDSASVDGEAWFYAAQAGGWFNASYASPCF